MPENSTHDEAPAQEQPVDQEATSQSDAEAHAEGTDWKAEARKWEQRAKDNKAAADKLAQIEEANKSDLQKALEANEKLSKENAALLLDKNRMQIAATRGLPADAVQFLTGSTLEEVEVSADNLLKLVGKSSKSPRVSMAGQEPAPSKDADSLAFVQGLTNR